MSNTTTMFDYKGEIFRGRELLAIEVGREIEEARIVALLKNIEGIEWVLELIEGKKDE